MTKLIKIVSLIAALCVLVSAQAEIVVDVFDHDTLQALDRPGVFSLGTIMGSREPALPAIFNTIKQDVEEIKTKAGVTMAFSSKHAERLGPAGNVARHFDPFWLTSSMASFPLVAVVNRVDKKDFYPHSCGEVRFIYRFAYKRAQPLARSTLPLFLNVVFEYSNNLTDNCASVAKRWDMALARGEAGAQQLLNGPLAAPMRLKQVELNMQIVRFPSGQETEFGGQAIYLFRIFQDNGFGVFEAVPLENTIDVAALSDSSLRTNLIKQIRDNLPKIDNGTFTLENTHDKRLLAKRALSFSTAGRGRLANRPFTAAFGPKGERLGQLDLAGLKFIKSPAGLIERLNNSTCVGCHQLGGTAGFHILGMGGQLNSAFNQVILPFSPHYSAERERRIIEVQKIATSQNSETFRPLSFMPGLGEANDRDLCLPDATDFKIINKCRTGTTCKVTVKNPGLGVTIGECVYSNEVVAGHVCRIGSITNAAQTPVLGDLFNLKSFKDKIDINTAFRPDACGHPKGGVPLGRTSKICTVDSREGRLEFVDNLNNASDMPKEFCAMRGGPQFDECAIAPDPSRCLEGAEIKRSMLDSCYPGRFCREDYICQQLPKAISRDFSGSQRAQIEARVEKLGKMSIGFCVPNYFIFNMRADGHIIPETRPVN